MTFNTATLGVVFIAVGFAAMFLMYHLWGYPFDKSRKLSAAPRWAMRLHRALGFLFAVLYVAMMWHMVPRLWEYQVEFPARTTVHIILGFTIGFLLVVKISIIRFFRHFEEWMPALGTAIMLCTVILLGLSLPLFYQERALAASAPGGGVTSKASRDRIATLLPEAGLPEGTVLEPLATAEALDHGRAVLLHKCVKCHDLKTILGRPRTPKGWWQLVERMADKPALFAPLGEREQLTVTAYLIAITPDLQRSVKAKREIARSRLEEMERAGMAIGTAGMEVSSDLEPDAGTEPAGGPGPAPAPVPAPGPTPGPAPGPRPTAVAAIDPAKARSAFEMVCSQCHELADVDASPPTSRRGAEKVIRRMITENDAEISSRDIRLIAFWLDEHYVKKTR